MSAQADLWEVIRGLWAGDHGRVAQVLPRDAPSLAAFLPSLKAFIDETPRRREGRIDEAAVVRGDIVSMGPGCVIEAGAVVHESCRLVIGARCRVRAGVLLRDEVVIGDDCLIGAHCEVTRSLLLGPETNLGHHNVVGDSIVGGHVNISGNVYFANNTLEPRGFVRMKIGGERIDSGRTHFGALVGNGVRFGGSTTLCPGCIVQPGLHLPPGVVLYGMIDETRRKALLRHFFATWDTNE